MVISRRPRTAVMAVFVVLTFVGCLDSATEHVVWGDWSGDSAVGCQSRNYYETIVRHATQDPEAFRQVMLSGDCVVLAKNETVYILERAFFSGLVKVRRRGELVEYWTASDTVTTSREAYYRTLERIQQSRQEEPR